MTFIDKEPVKRVEKIIKEFDENLSVSVLKTSARTALEAASSLNCDVGAIVKSLLFKTDNKFCLFLIAGDKKASLKKIKKNIKFSDVSMASADEVKSITGYTIGGVSPVGHINDVDIYIDNSLERFNFLFAAAGHPNCIFKISFLNLKQITKGVIEDIIE
ncbi:YbaK/EbsC family protein [Candidatus Pelagibacter sp.]|nr:YbaK/EbsC family protein [Candidatus Pelagibacter sp.]